jgi:hypothetical protein
MYPYFYPTCFRMAKPMPAVPGATMPLVPGAMQPNVEPKLEKEPSVFTDVQYIQGYLKKHVGWKVRIEFLIGTGTLIDRTGTLMDVGTSYVVIQPVGTDDLLMADIYSIKFVTFMK